MTAATTEVEVKALARQLRCDIGVTGPRSRVRGGAFYQVGYIANNRRWAAPEWPHSVVVATLGMARAYNTGRLSVAAQRHIDGLSPWRTCTLIAEVAVHCHVLADVPDYLNRHRAA